MLQEDLSPFLADFGQLVTLLGRQVTAIFDNGYTIGDVGIGGMATTQPTLTMATSDVPPEVINWTRYFTEPRDPIDTQVQIAGKTYAIVTHEPDGTGISVLKLEAVT